MRALLSTLVVAASIGFGGFIALAAAPDPDVVQAKAELATASQAILAYYPTEALTKGVSGTATLKCRRTQLGGYADCIVASETPADSGFGAAALAIAQRATQSPSANIPADQALEAHDVVFSFSANPASIEPNVLLSQVIEPLAWQGVTAETERRYYPELAQRLAVPGKVVLDCFANANGAYQNCVVTHEEPKGYGFGTTALGMTLVFKSKPSQRGMRSVIPLHFVVPVR